MYFNEEHKRKVEERGDGYEYIGSYRRNEETIDGKNKNKSKDFRGQGYIRVKCPYCKNEYDVQLSSFIGKYKSKCTNCCNEYENSFAYYIQVELGEGLNKYWNWEKNTVNPYLIYRKNNKNTIYIYCQEQEYHNDGGGYPTTPSLFHKEHRCGYCNRKKVHSKDSFAYLYPEKAKYWSKNNKKSPYEVAPHSHKKFNFICEECNREFKRDLHTLNSSEVGVLCDNCNGSTLEYKTKEILNKYDIKYKAQVKYDDLIGTKGGKLYYDFYLSDYNLLIECQGEQHEKFIKGLHETKENFEKQLEHDKRKKEYAKQHNIDLLEIWYNELNDIEDILINKLNLK